MNPEHRAGSQRLPACVHPHGSLLARKSSTLMSWGRARCQRTPRPYRLTECGLRVHTAQLWSVVLRCLARWENSETADIRCPKSPRLGTADVATAQLPAERAACPGVPSAR